jgi:hypothetical protein
MKIKITNLIGPMLESSHEFLDKDEIRIGRDPKSDVLYPPEFTTVGRHHLVLALDSGHYELRVNTKNPVYIDKQLAGDDVELPDTCVISLGVAEGPSFKVERIQSDELPKTVDYGQQQEIHHTVSRSKAWLKAAILLILVFAGGFGYQAWDTAQSIERINQQAGEVIEDIYKELDQDIGKEINKASESVYLVVIKSETGESPVGTAWVATNNALATNAHVAEIFDQIGQDSDASFYVRSTVAPYQEHKIERVLLHPGFHAFAKAWQKANPQSLDASGKAESVKLIPGYDVALLYPDSQAVLQKPLKLADESTLKHLSSGDQVAYAGFPMEGVFKQDFIKPSTTIQVANITSITDFFRSQSAFGDLQLIQHSLPAIGGASGSPIINAKGEVIGLLNAGNVVGVTKEGDRIGSAVAINYAQRVDLLQKLIEQGDQLDLSSLEQSWEQGFKRYSNKQEVAEKQNAQIIKSVVNSWKQYVRVNQASQVMRQSVVFYANRRIQGIPAIMQEFEAPDDGNYLVMAVESNQVDIDMLVGTVQNGRFKELERNTRPDFYPSLNVKLKRGSKLVVYLLHSELADSGQLVANAELVIYH